MRAEVKQIMAGPSDKKIASSSADPRSLARLFAVQAAYQIEMTGVQPETVAAEYRAHAFDIGDDEIANNPDEELFATLLSYFSDGRIEIDALIESSLSEGLGSDRLEALIKAILRCGIGELRGNRQTPQSVIINEYVDIAHAFYSGKEPGLINGILDSAAKALKVPAGTS
jgi:N utilization substance protein B